MIDNIAILITGNPVSSSGVRSIGGIGTGLTVIDPKWPSMAQGNLALIITDKGQSSNYCLMFPSRLISSSGANREGVLNIQLQLPHGKMLADAEGTMVSPFTLMEEVFNHYKQHHLTQYPGVEGWNFAKDWEMTQAEFDSLLAPYTLIDRVLPTRHLSGTGEAFIAMSADKMAQFTLDHAYPELVDYGKVILSTGGNTNPPELARLEIPRRPQFEIYVNGKKQDGLVRKGDEAFSMTIKPPYPQSKYQMPATVVVDFEKAVADGKVDRANERIDYTVKFEDKVETRTVKIELTGCENSQNLYNTLIKQLLDKVKLQYPEAYTKPIEPTKKDADTRTLTFTLKGAELEHKWEPKLDDLLPTNVRKKETTNVYNGYVLKFHYEMQQKKQDELKRIDKTKAIEPKKGVEEVSVFITSKDVEDRELTSLSKNIEFDMTFILDEENDINLLTYYGIRCDSNEPTEFNRGGKTYPCYEGKVEVPVTLWNNWIKYAKAEDVKAESCDPRYKLKAKLNKGKKDGDSPYIAVYASRTSKWAIIWRRYLLNTLFVLLVLFGCAVIGAYIENNRDLLPNPKTEVAPNAPQEVPDPVVTIGDNGRVYINNEIEVTIGENGHWIIAGEDQGRTLNNKIAGEKTPTDNPIMGTSNDPAPTGSDNVNYAALNAASARYMELIRKADMTFAQVDEIKKWIDGNSQHRRKIDNYGKIAAAIKDFGKCRDVLLKININADIDALCPQIKTVVSALSKDELLRELRIKMQRFLYEGGKSLKKDEQIKDKIYQFSVKHPNGISSFKELEDLKEIRVLK